MRQGGGNAELHLHAAGKILEAFVKRQGKASHVGVINRAVPAFIYPRHDPAYLLCGQPVREGRFVHYNAYLLLKWRVAPVGVLTEDNYRPHVLFHHAENALDSGAFASSVSP